VGHILQAAGKLASGDHPVRCLFVTQFAGDDDEEWRWLLRCTPPPHLQIPWNLSAWNFLSFFFKKNKWLLIAL
jgi:hypothetical protein